MKTEEMKEFFKTDRFANNIGCLIDEAQPGHAVVSLEIEDKHLNGNNVAQGGVLFTLGDLACAAAACADGTVSVSAGGSINYLNPGKGKMLFAEATELKKGRTLSYYDFLITNETGNKIAKGSFTMFRIK